MFISIDEARLKYNAGIAKYVDARDEFEFKSAHIKRAVNIPALDYKVDKKAFPFTGKPVELILYCDGPECGASEILARKIISAGYTRNIYILEPGLPAWENRGLPIENGKGD